MGLLVDKFPVHPITSILKIIWSLESQFFRSFILTILSPLHGLLKINKSSSSQSQIKTCGKFYINARSR